MRRLDIGICSYGTDPAKLRCAVASIQRFSTTDWRLFIIHNPSAGDEQTRSAIETMAVDDARIQKACMPRNVGYAGAVNKLLEIAETEYVAYCDNDIEIHTEGWDGRMAELLDGNPECGQVFPGRGHYGFHNGRYDECLWSAGYCWMLRIEALEKTQGQCLDETLYGMDTGLGHHEEVDLMIRLRLAGYQIGCLPEVNVSHHETATKANAADHQPGGRIHDGVVRWMNKYNRYFCGDQLKYSMTAYDPRALRYTDWPPDALYLERMTLAMFPDWNKTPRSVNVPGVGEMDVIEVLKPKGCYVGRAI